MIRSTKTTLNFVNRGKLNETHHFIDEYRSVVSVFVDLLWNQDKIPTLLPKSITSQVQTWLSARMVQCAGKQASGIARGTQCKQKQRKWMIDKLHEEGKHKQARKLQKIYDKILVSKPDISHVEPELDSRFVKVGLGNDTSFDGWLTLICIGEKLRLVLPFKRTKHFNSLFDQGNLKPGVRLSKKSVTFMFDLPDIPLRQKGSVVGIDIGQSTAISCSNGFTSTPDSHGHTLVSITDTMTRKAKGGKAFGRCKSHRKNYINWTINELNLGGVKQVNIENIKYLRRGRRTSRRLSHWTYTSIFDKLESCCEEQGVLVSKVSPTYTSQRCSACGWTRKSNRNGKLFKCGACGFALDSDLNASRNIALPLPGITKQQRLQQPNRTGFYWEVEGQECIVPAV